MKTLLEKPMQGAKKETPKEAKTEAKKEARPRKPLPCVTDWEFWRFVMAALSLAWEIAKTFVR